MSTSPDIVPTRLEVAKADFVEELTRLGKVLGRRDCADAVLRFEDGRLRISIGGAEVGIAAQGDWQGEARVSAAWIRILAKVPPAMDPVVVQVAGGRMRIGSSSNVCAWQVPGAAVIEVPLAMGLRERLQLVARYSDADLVKSGLAPMVADARAELEKRIASATRQLGPLGITAADLRVLVIGKLDPPK